MAVDRVGTSAHAQIMLAQIQRASAQLMTTERQVASGKVSHNYAGLGTQTAALETARAAAARAQSFKTSAKEALRRLDLQDLQVTRLGELASELRLAMTDTLAGNDGTALMAQAASVFERAREILNAKDANGYLYGGERDGARPVTVGSLDELLALPDAASAFANGAIKRAVRVDEAGTVEIGLLASDLGTQLFGVLRGLAAFHAGSDGPFGQELTPAQRSFLESQIPAAIGAAQDLNAAAATNGYRHNQVSAAIERLDATAAVYKSFISDLEEVDLGEAVSRLNQNQVALAAALKVSSQLNRLSLLDFL